MLFILARLASTAEAEPYVLLKGRIAFTADHRWSLLGQGALRNDGAIFQIPKDAQRRALFWVQAKPQKVFEEAIDHNTDSLSGDSSSSVLVKRLPLEESATDALLLSRDTRAEPSSLVVSVDRIAQRASFTVHIRAEWILPSVSSEELKWLVDDANRVMTETVVDGMPIGSVGRIVLRSDPQQRMGLPTVDIE